MISLSYKNSYNLFLKGKILDKCTTQTVFAKKIGVSRTTVSNWIGYHAKPTFKDALKVEQILEIPVKELFPKRRYGNIHAN